MISLQLLYVKSFRRAVSAQGGAGWVLGHEEMLEGYQGRRGQGGQGTTEMILVFGDPEMANELEMATQGRGGETQV